MPPKNFKSVSVPDHVAEQLHRLSEKWEKELGTRLSYGQVIQRLININTKKK